MRTIFFSNLEVWLYLSNVYVIADSETDVPHQIRILTSYQNIQSKAKQKISSSDLQVWRIFPIIT